MKYKTWPKINPVCRFTVWIVQTSERSTTNPMTKRAALKMIKERKKKGLYAELIKAFSCVEAKKLMDIN